jgi:Tfp pilus assembly PilM family ATPase
MSSRVFAVDLGAWSVKVAIASPGIRGAALLNVLERRVPPGSDPVEQRAKSALSQLITEQRLKEDPGYVGVYGDQVFTQILDFPFKSLRRSELDKAVGNELESVVPVDLEDMVYTFEQLPPLPAEREGEGGPMPPEAIRGRVAPPVEGMRVLSYAMQRERAEQLIAMGKDCGFNAKGILACGGAAIRLVDRLPSLERARADGPIAVIDIGHERTDVIVVCGGKAVFSRSIARAGRHVTDAIVRATHVTFEDAEAAKHHQGFVASQSEPATSEAWARVHQITITELAPFARDLRQTLIACRARTGFTPIAAILVGGGARLQGMASFLGEQLGIPTWRPSGDDLAALAGNRLIGDFNTMPLDAAAMTVGAAFDAAGGRPSFDLRSGALAVKMDLSFLRAKAVPLGAAALAIAAFAATAAYANLYRLRKAEKVLAARLATETAEHYGTAKTAAEVIKSNDGSPGGPGGAGSPMPKMSAYDVLLEISTKIPAKDKITLDIDQLTIDTEKIFLKATTKTSEEIDLLKGQLRSIECVKDVNLGAVTAGDRQSFTFTLTSSCM